MYNLLVPLHYQTELIQIGEDITRHTFRIGDIILSTIDYVEANNMDCTKRDVWRAIGSLIGKAAGTVRGYEELSVFYPLPVRNIYEVLSASHFRMAMRIDTQTEYTWKNALDYAIDKVDEYGRPATVDELMKVFIYNSEPFDFEDEPMGGSVVDPVSEFVLQITKLSKIVELLPIPEHRRAEIKDTLERIIRVFA